MTRDALSSTARHTGPLNLNYRLIYERQQLNLTQDELAAHIGATKASIIRWEHGYLPSPYYRKQLCAFFGKSMQDLGWSDVEAERLQRGTAHPTLEVSGQRPAVRPFLAPALPGHQVIGREAMLAALKGQLFNHKSLALSAIDGLPGVGKTTLAIALAYDPEVRAHFPDGVLWAGLGRRADVLLHLGRWGMALGVSHHELEKLPDIPSRQQRLRAIMAERRLLLVVDDVWEREVALDMRVGGNQCAFLITTRLPAVAEYIAPESILLVQELSEDDGLALLGQLAPQAVKAAPEEALQLVRAVGGLPLALILMGKYLRGRVHRQQTTRQKQRSLQAALERLQQMEWRVRLAGRPDTPEIHPSLHHRAMISLEAVIAMSDEVLEPTPRELLRALSVFPPKPSTFSEEAALAVGAAPASTLDLLTNAGLLEGSGEDRYALHQTIADYARAKRSGMAAEERMAEYFVRLVEQHETDYHLLEQETNNVLAALQLAFERGMQTALVRGVNGFSRFLQARGLYTLAKAQMDQAQASARSLSDTVSLIKMLFNLGEIVKELGDYAQAEAYLQEGLTLSRRSGQQETTIPFLRSLGVLKALRGDYMQAEVYLQEGLTLARKFGQPEVISVLLQTLGAVIDDRGNSPQAEVYLQEGLTLARKIGQPEVISALLQTLGAVVIHLEDYIRAEGYFQEGLFLARQIGHYVRIGSLLLNLGAVAEIRGDYMQAEAYLQEGLTVAYQIGHSELISALLSNLGEVILNRGNYAQAGIYLQQALDLARKLDYPERICQILGVLGEVALKQEDYERAKVYLQEGLTTARQIEHFERISGLLQNLGRLEMHRDNYIQAEAYLQEGLTVARQIEHHWFVGSILSDIGELYLKKRLFPMAYTSFQEALEMTKEGMPALVATAQFGIARVAAAQGKNDEACKYGQASLAVFDAIGHGRVSEVKQWLAELPTMKKDTEL